MAEIDFLLLVLKYFERVTSIKPLAIGSLHTDFPLENNQDCAVLSSIATGCKRIC